MPLFLCGLKFLICCGRYWHGLLQLVPAKDSLLSHHATQACLAIACAAIGMHVKTACPNGMGCNCKGRVYGMLLRQKGMWEGIQNMQCWQALAFVKERLGLPHNASGEGAMHSAPKLQRQAHVLLLVLQRECRREVALLH